MFTDDELAAYLRIALDDLDQAWVNLKRDIIESEITDITGELDPVPAWVKGIALEATRRAWANPDQYKSETINNEYTYVRETDAASGSSYLTDAETLRLRRLAGGRSVVGSTRLVTVFDCPADLTVLPTP